MSNFSTVEEGRLVKENFLAKRIANLFCTETEFLFLLSTSEHIEDCVDAKQFEFEERVRDLAEGKEGDYTQLIKSILGSDVINLYGRFLQPFFSFNSLIYESTSTKWL